MLDGALLVIEGRGYRADGSTGFNAFAVVSYDPEAAKYEIRSYAQGYAGTFELKPTDTGYVWEVPAGPGVMRFTADITDSTYHEVGDFVMPGMAPMRSFEMQKVTTCSSSNSNRPVRNWKTKTAIRVSATRDCSIVSPHLWC